MTPLKGIVHKASAVLTVRLKTRALVDIPRHPQLKLGDTCYVLYDFTRMQVRDIWTEEEFFAHDDVSGGAFHMELPPHAEKPEELAVDPTVVLDVSL